MADEKANLKAQMLLEEANLMQSVPDDFLRLPVVPSSSSAPPPTPTAAGLMVNGIPYHAVAQNYVPGTDIRGRLMIRIGSARLTKNYGIVRMDPYVRVAIGKTLYETPVNANGGKAPVWNCTLEAFLENNVNAIMVQIFDERSFTADECVAWVKVPLPQAIFNGETIDEWYKLSGRQGPDEEGVVNLTISYRDIDPAELEASRRVQVPLQQIDPELAAAIEASKNETTAAPVAITDEVVSEMTAMFPSIDVEIIRAILEDKRGDTQAAATALIELAD